MPGKFALKQSSAHRLACTSLYKRLLAACNELTPTAASSSPLASQLKNLVRYRYRFDRRLQSPQQIRDALSFGRKALEMLLEASDGSPMALSRLTQVLSRCARMIERNHPISNNTEINEYDEHTMLSKKENFLQIANDPTTHACNPDSVPILERPVDLSRIKGGKRYVPHFVVTQGVSFLRYGTKQPYGLSLNIRDQINKGQKMRDYQDKMQYMAELGTLEDQWDRHMVDLGAQEDDIIDKRTGWARVYQDAKQATYSRLGLREGKLLEHAKKLWNIKLQEEALAAQEKEEFRQQKKKKTQVRDVTSMSDIERTHTDSFLGE